MLELIRAEFLDVLRKLRIVIAELGQLASVMLVDLGLDGIGAGQRRFFGHECGRRAKGEAGDVPHRLQGGGPSAC